MEGREGQIKNLFSTTPPLSTSHPSLVREGNVNLMNYLLPHGGAAPATGPGWGKAEEKSQDHPPLSAAPPSRFWAGKEPAWSQSLAPFMELQEDLK